MSLSSPECFLESLRRKRAPAVARAAVLIRQGRFGDAEDEVLAADATIYGAVALASLYRTTLREAVHSGGRPKHGTWFERLHARAAHWADQTLPPAHTSNEADEYTRARAEARDALAFLAGGHEGAWTHEVVA